MSDESKLRIETEAEWLQARASGIGASDIATVCGLNPYQSPLQLWAQKCDLAEPDDLSENEAVEWGKRLEGVIAKKYAEETGHTVSDHGEFTMYRHLTHDWCICTPDRFIVIPHSDEPKGVLEIKTAGAHLADAWEDGPPEHYEAQIQWQMFVTGMKWGVLACLIGGRQFVYAEVRRNDRMIEELFDRANEFWQMVKDREQPPATWQDSGVLKDLFPSVETSTPIKLDGEAIDLDDQIQAAKAHIKEWTQQKDEAENRIKQMIGSAESGVLPNGVKYSFKEQHRKSYTVEAKDFRVLRRKKGR